MTKGNKEPKEVQECRGCMAKILGRTSLFVKSQPLQPPCQRYYFSSYDSSMAEAGDRVYPVVLFCMSGTSKYWLGLSIDVRLGHKCHLENVSLVVFEGESSDAAKTPAFRAEWDYTNESAESKHAQPHWHVYSVIDELAAGNNDAFDPEPKVKDFKTVGSGTGKRFHFAMASQWHESKCSHTCHLDFDNVCKWLDGCVDYIRGQFEYLHSS
jgi:hypothetical protein